MIFVFMSTMASTLSAAATMPSIDPPLDRSMKGYMPLKKQSPMCTTLAFLNWTTVSPSVWAGATWKARMSSPFRWKVTESAKVMMGRATFGRGRHLLLEQLA